MEHEEITNHISGPLTVVAPRSHRSDRDIKAEIRALEAERRAVRLEREADEKRWQAERLREHEYYDGEYEIIERRDAREKDIVRVEKDRKGRLALVKSAR